MSTAIRCRRGPRWMPVAGIALHPRLVVLRADIFDDPRARTTIGAHEAVHVEQMRRLGWLRFVGRYCTPAGRLDLECEAFGRVDLQPWVGRPGFDGAVREYADLFRRGGLYFPRWLPQRAPRPQDVAALLARHATVDRSAPGP